MPGTAVSVRIEQTIEPAEEDAAMWAAHRFHVMRPWAIIGAGMFAFVGLLTGLIEPKDGDKLGHLLKNSLPWFLIGAGWLTYALVPLARLARFVGKGYGRLEEAFGRHSRSLDAEGFHLRGVALHHDIPWETMRRAEETKEFFLVFDFDGAPYHLAKARMTADEQATARVLVKQHLTRHTSIG